MTTDLFRLYDKPPVRPKDQERAEIEAQVKEFLANGGKIQVFETVDAPAKRLAFAQQSLQEVAYSQ